MRVSRRKFVAGIGSVIFFSAPLGSALAAATDKKPIRYAMIHDETRCNGCNICVTACRRLNKVPTGMARMDIAHIPLSLKEDNDKYHFHVSSVKMLLVSRFVLRAHLGAMKAMVLFALIKRNVLAVVIAYQPVLTKFVILIP